MIARKTKPSTPRAAFTLVELMVASTILTITTVGVLSGLLQARRATEGSIHIGTATTVAQGYIEQLKHMEYEELEPHDGVTPVSIDDFVSQGALDSLSVSPYPADPTVGDADTDVVNAKNIDINNTPDYAEDDLTLNFVLYIRDIGDSSIGVGDARQLALRWFYTDRTTTRGNTVGNTLFAVRSRVPSY